MSIEVLFNKLLVLTGDDFAQVPVADHAQAESIRTALVKRLSRYKMQLSACGIPNDQLPQSLKMTFDSETSLATYRIGARKKALAVSFKIITPNA